MTTPEAERLYLARHLAECAGKRWALYNPEDLPPEELPVIYGFNNGGPPGLLSAVLLAEDGTHLGGHCCSHEGYMEHDLGILEGARPDRHEGFREHYPKGYRMEFIGWEEVKKGHEGLEKAYKLNQEKRPEKEANDG